MSRYSLGTPAAADLTMDNHSNDLLRMPLKEPSDNTSPNSTYSPYAFPSELKSAHSNGQLPVPLLELSLNFVQQTTKTAPLSLIL